MASLLHWLTLLSAFLVVAMATDNCPIDFSATSPNKLSVDLPQYTIRQSGPQLHLVVQTPSGVLWERTFFRVDLDNFVEIDDNGDIVPSAGPILYLTNSTCSGRLVTETIADALAPTKLVTKRSMLFDFVFPNGFWFQTTIATFDQDIYLTEPDGPTYLMSSKSAKLGVEMGNFTFTVANTTKLRSQMRVGVYSIDNLSFFLGTVDVHPADITLPTLNLACNNITANELILTMCVEQWGRVDGQISNGIENLPTGLLQVEPDEVGSYMGSVWNVRWPQFKHAVWDPSFGLLFTGTDPGVPIPPTTPEEGSTQMSPTTTAAILVPVLVVVFGGATLFAFLFMRRRRVSKIQQTKRMHSILSQNIPASTVQSSFAQQSAAEQK